MPEKQLLSIVVPVFNEETNILPFYRELAPVLSRLDMAAEIIFVNDGSSDDTQAILSELARQDERVKCLRFSRNFGSHPAVMAGLQHASGDVMAIISVDLQDPPELMIEMLEKWQGGAKVVWAVRESRDDPWSKKLFALAFYKLFSRIALKNYPKTGMDFGLFDRQVIDHLNRLKEVNNFYPGLILWLGYPQASVLYHRRERLSGVSKWSLGKRIKNALDAICSFSYFPVRFISYTGVVISLCSFIFALVVLIRRIFFGLGDLGWPSIMVTLLFLGGVQLIMLGILGEYIWRGTDQSRNRPQYIIMDSIGFESQDEEDSA